MVLMQDMEKALAIGLHCKTRRWAANIPVFRPPQLSVLEKNDTASELQRANYFGLFSQLLDT